MPIEFQCPTCGRKISASDEDAGKPGKCKQCGEPIRVPQKRDNLISVAKPAVAPELLIPKPAPAPAPTPTVELRPPQQTASVQPMQTAVVVSVQQSPTHSNSLGIASMVLGAMMLPLSCIPFAGAIAFPIAGIGAIMAVVGFFAALKRNGSGIGYPIAGGALCCVALCFSAGSVWILMSPAIETARKARERVEEKHRQKKAESPTLPESDAELTAKAWLKQFLKSPHGEAFHGVDSLSAGDGAQLVKGSVTTENGEVLTRDWMVLVEQADKSWTVRCVQIDNKMVYLDPDIKPERVDAWEKAATAENEARGRRLIQRDGE
ncbi:MAG: hypothetical protein WD648_14075 [Planctomycetaceae bacterium]